MRVGLSGQNRSLTPSIYIAKTPPQKVHCTPSALQGYMCVHSRLCFSPLHLEIRKRVVEIKSFQDEALTTFNFLNQEARYVAGAFLPPTYLEENIQHFVSSPCFLLTCSHSSGETVKVSVLQFLEWLPKFSHGTSKFLLNSFLVSSSVWSPWSPQPPPPFKRKERVDIPEMRNCRHGHRISCGC